MKYDEKESTPVIEACVQNETPNPALDELAEKSFDEVTMSGDSAVDKLQATVYRAGVRLVPILERAEESLEERAKKPLEKTDEAATTSEAEKKVNPMAAVNSALKELGHFAYDVGFAGEQSCGKSTVVNSLLQYPLMPTCKAPTTASVVQIAYSEHFRVRAIDDDTQKIVLDFDCEMPKNPNAQRVFRQRFDKLLDYAISAMDILIIENFQYFTDITVADKPITVKDVEMTPEDPKHVMLLLFILLAVYVGQNDPEWNEAKRQLMESRKSIFSYLGIPKDTINISVKSQGQFDILKSGLIITDLPGLGSNAAHQDRSDGRKIKGHDEITIEAIQHTDSMVFLTTPENREAGYKVLPEMLSSAKLKETIYKGDRIIPVLNKADTCGEQEKRTTIQAFCTALKASNVEKKPEDIRLYSGILGEYKFKDLPFERTLFFKTHYNEESLREEAELDGLDFEEIKNREIRRQQIRMKKKYEKSGIEDMLKFFRTSYVEVGKFNKSTAALQEIRAMVMAIVAELNATVKICQTIIANNTQLQENLVKDLKSAVETPIQNTSERQTTTIERIHKDFDEANQDSEKTIAEVYAKSFEAALEAYKTKLLGTLGEFSCSVLGFSKNARIDVAGSENRRLYLKLLDEIDDFPISLVKVNGVYEKILKGVRIRIDRFYADSLKDLNALKEDIRVSLERSIEAAKNNITPAEIKSLEAVKNELLVLVKKQIEVVTLNLAQQQQDEIDAMDGVLSAVLALNTEITGAYATAIKKQLSEKISNGFFFTTREYLLIDGDNGMRSAMNALQLSEEDTNNISLNLEANVSGILMSKISGWLQSLYIIAFMYDALGTRLKRPMQGIIDVMTGKIEESESKLNATKEEIWSWYGICDSFSREIRPFLEDARSYMKDKEDSNLWLQKNIFYGCFDKELEDEYERIRNAQ